MSIYKLKLVCLTLILVIASCREKDELTLPGKIHLKILFYGEGHEYFEFGGGFGIQRIRFEGKREVGEDVFFETDPTINFQEIPLGKSPVEISTFDIPRGVYNYMKWDIDLKKISEFILMPELDTLKIGLVIHGQSDMMYWMGIPPIMFAIDDTVKLSFMSSDDAKFVLSENKDCYIYLSLNANYAFSSVSLDSIEKLEPTGPKWHQIVLISHHKNQDLYEDILYRIIQSLKISVF